MMKLSVMQSLMSTVDPRWQSPVADEILAHWPHDSPGAWLLRASSNFVFGFKYAGKPYILRFVHASQRSPAALRAEVEFLRYLSSLRVRANQPVPALSGEDIVSLDTPIGPCHALVFEAFTGEQFETDDLDQPRLFAWGRAAGELHNACQGYPGDGRPSWQDQLASAAAALPAHDTFARRAFDRLSGQLAQLPVSEQNFGLIHFDFESDNLIWEGLLPGIIDFDDCARNWFAADIALALRDLFGDRASQVDLRDARFGEFMRGYRSVKEIDEEELAQIPLFLRFSNILKYAELLPIVEEESQPGEPDWLVKLRQKLKWMVERYREEMVGESRKLSFEL
jgi:Ser/Thr protein kinase RdoA (MazF antagonist)